MADGVAAVALVAMQDGRFGHLVEQRVGGTTVHHLAAGQQEGDRAAEAIGQHSERRWLRLDLPLNIHPLTI